MAAAGSDGARSRAVPGQPGGKAAFSAQHTTDREIADHAIRSERLDMAAQRDFAVDHDALTESCPSEEKRLDLQNDDQDFYFDLFFYEVFIECENLVIYRFASEDEMMVTNQGDTARKQPFPGDCRDHPPTIFLQGRARWRDIIESSKASRLPRGSRWAHPAAGLGDGEGVRG